MNSVISVVIPAFNNEPFIEQAMRSVLEQQDVDLELIVADHASTDRTRDRIESLADDPRVSVLSTAPGGGAAANFRRVSAAAQGDFIKLLPGDDFLLPGVLARQQRALIDHPRAVMTACRRQLVDARGHVVWAAHGLRGARQYMSGPAAIRHVVRAGSNVFGEPGCVLMRRTAFEAAGGWDFTHPYLVDEATYANVLQSGDFIGDMQPGAAFRLNNGQWSVALADEQYRQVASFHRLMHARDPLVVRSADVRIGNTRAWLMAQRRRLTYRILRRRMG